MANTNALSMVAPLIPQFVANYAQNTPADNGGSSADRVAQYGKALTQLNNAFQTLLSLDSQDPQGAIAQQPTPYSTDGIPADVQSDPMSQLSADDLSRIQDLGHESMMMASAYLSGREATVRDHRHTDSASGAPGGVVVRDHRHPEGSTTVVIAPPAAPRTGSAGDVFTSGEDFDRLNDANSTFKDAKQAALDDPTDPAKQAAFQDAAQALQLLANMLMQMSSMFASIADNAIKSSKVQSA